MKIWKVKFFCIEAHYHSGYRTVCGIAKDAFAAGELARGTFNKSKNYRDIQIQSIEYVGDKSFEQALKGAKDEQPKAGSSASPKGSS